MKNFDLRNFLVEGKKAKEEKVDEAGPGFMHDCAAHVVHETYGYGICLDGEHTLVENADGTHSVTHYDVFFKEGNKTVKNIPVGDLEVLTESNHGHKKKKNEADVAEEGETVEEAAGIASVAAGAILTLIAKVGLDTVLHYLAKAYPDKFKKANDKLGFNLTDKLVGKDAIGDFTRGGKGRYGESVDEAVHDDKDRKKGGGPDMASIAQHTTWYNKEGKEVELEEDAELIGQILGPGMAALGTILSMMIAKIGMDQVLQFLADKFPDQFKKLSDKSSAATDKAMGAIQKGMRKAGIPKGDGTRYGGGSGRMAETEDQLREERLRKEVEAILGK